MTPDRPTPEPLPPELTDGFDCISPWDLPAFLLDEPFVVLEVDEPTEDTAPYVPLAR